MNIIEILLKNQKFDEIKIYVNQKLQAQQRSCASIIVEFDHELPVEIDVEFWPFFIRPMVRYNGFMLDYWLSNIMLQDHKFSLTVSPTFFKDYRTKNIQGRIDSLSEAQKNHKHFFDQYIGVNNGYPEIVGQIKKLIEQ